MKFNFIKIEDWIFKESKRIRGYLHKYSQGFFLKTSLAQLLSRLIMPKFYRILTTTMKGSFLIDDCKRMLKNSDYALREVIWNHQRCSLREIRGNKTK